jgi:Uncharacterized conserved protein
MKDSTVNKDEIVCLYILMRTDLASMNPGKAVAQGAHAANQCIATLMDPSDRDLYEEWVAQTSKGFGTTVTLGVNARQMYETISIARELGFHAGVVHDPTYPLRDGDVVHYLPLDTCGFVFGRKSHLTGVVGDLPLAP